ncbi:MAG: hypothetical protein V1493_01485 [Candidatus Diapherotrites archaeon]
MVKIARSGRVRKTKLEEETVLRGGVRVLKTLSGERMAKMDLAPWTPAGRRPALLKRRLSRKGEGFGTKVTGRAATVGDQGMKQYQVTVSGLSDSLLGRALRIRRRRHDITYNGKGKPLVLMPETFGRPERKKAK